MPTAREMEKLIERDGWIQVAQKGSHRQYKHGTKKGRVTIPWHGNGNDDIAIGTEKNIRKQAGL